jgi:hypothetical protein
MMTRNMCPHETPDGIKFVTCDLSPVPAFMRGLYGGTVDHLYEDCQHLQRWPDQVRRCADLVCPAGSDLCRTCARRYLDHRLKRSPPNAPVRRPGAATAAVTDRRTP